MKHTIKLLSAFALAAALVGCGSSNDADISFVENNNSSNTATSETTPQESAEATSETTEIVAEDIYAEDGYGVGYMEDTFHTYFFDFTVNDGALYETYGDYTPDEGNVFVELEITVKNTMSSDIEMYDYDFFLSYGDGDDEYVYPITDSDGKGLEPVFDMLPSIYTLQPAESRTGTLVFEIPEASLETNYIDLMYVEYFDDDTNGDAFIVYIAWPESAETE